MNGKIMLNGKAYSSSGRPSKEVTMSEWLALPDTKYTDGIVYYIKDVGSSSQYPPLIYSDYEREVGVWTDGKPLYQKTISTTFPNVTTDGSFVNKEVDVSDLSIDRVVDYDIVVSMNSDFYKVTYVQNSGYQAKAYYRGSDSKMLLTSNGTAFSQKPCFITIIYTKTTDLPGSGMWNTDGGKMHHYSTNEKVIGTWTNGNPLYEKVFNINAAPSSLASNWLQAYNVKSIKWGYIHYWSANIEKMSFNFGFNTSNRTWSSTESEWCDFVYLQYTKTTD